MIMKKLFLLAICTWQFAAQAQELSKPLNESGNCPEGYCAGFFIEIEIDKNSDFIFLNWIMISKAQASRPKAII